MQYFKITNNIIDRDRHKQKIVSDIPSANGEFVPNGKHYFDRMGSGEIIENAPIFDYFHLQSFGPEEEWEWRKQDIHGFIGVGSILTGWYISDFTKKVFEQHLLALDYSFFKTKLLFQGLKYDYWIFQYFQKGNVLPKTTYINFEKSIFIDFQKHEMLEISDFEEYKLARNKIKQESNYERDVKIIRLNLNNEVDFLPLLQIHEGIIVSSKLKNAIEEAGLVGFEFTELDYEILVDTPPLSEIFRQS